MKWLGLICSAALITPALTSAADLGQKLDARVRTSEGKLTRLSAYFGKPVLLFYEDPDSVRVNQAWKDELAARAAKLNLAGKLEVVAVCNLEKLNWQPALFFALLAVRSEEHKAKVPVLVDLSGELGKAPWSLSAKASSVVLLSPSGEVLFQSMGLMSHDTFDELLVQLSRVLLPTAQAAPAATEAHHG